MSYYRNLGLYHTRNEYGIRSRLKIPCRLLYTVMLYKNIIWLEKNMFSAFLPTIVLYSQV